MIGFLDRVVPEKVLRAVDNWKFGFLVLLLAVGAVAVWVAFVASTAAQTQAHAAREQAIRLAGIQSDYKDCLHSVKPTQRVNRFLGGVNDLAAILVLNSQAALDAEPPGDPLHKTRVENLARLRRAQRNVSRVRAFPVPTEDSCAARRDKALARG